MCNLTNDVPQVRTQRPPRRRGEEAFADWQSIGIRLGRSTAEERTSFPTSRVGKTPYHVQCPD